MSQTSSKTIIYYLIDENSECIAGPSPSIEALVEGAKENGWDEEDMASCDVAKVIGILKFKTDVSLETV